MVRFVGESFHGAAAAAAAEIISNALNFIKVLRSSNEVGDKFCGFVTLHWTHTHTKLGPCLHVAPVVTRMVPPLPFADAAAAAAAAAHLIICCKGGETEK